MNIFAVKIEKGTKLNHHRRVANRHFPSVSLRHKSDKADDADDYDDADDNAKGDGDGDDEEGDG